MADQERNEGRAAVERKARRRRGDETLAPAKRLPIPPEIEARLKAEGRTPRWANDEGDRIYRLTERDDYDKVEGVAPVPTGIAKDGTPIMAHLLSKPNEFIREDRDKAEERRMATQKALFRDPNAAQQVAGNPGNSRSAPEATTYLDPASKIRRGGNEIID